VPNHSNCTSYAWNPLEATERLYKDYFNFFLTSFAPNNFALQQKLKKELESEYLQRGPYISISGQFKRGIPFSNYEKTRLRDEVRKAFSFISYLYEHQEQGINNILDGKNTIAAIPTGSGKTEIFIIPILNYCFEHRGEPGIKAIIVYPMNALANDQVERLRKILWIINKDLPENKKITFAIYTGDTPENSREMKEGDKSLVGLLENCFIPEEYKKSFGCSPDCEKRWITYDAEKELMYCQNNERISIGYQILTRESIRKKVPDILITNYVQLEHLILRKEDDVLFSSSNVKFLVFDEIHTYSGARGVDVALLIRRLRSRLKTNPLCIGTSATLSTSDPFTRKKEIANFAEKFFGVRFEPSDVIEGTFEEFPFEPPIKLNQLEKITEIEDIDDLDSELLKEDLIKNICEKIYPNNSYKIEKPYSLLVGKLLLQNPVFQVLVRNLKQPTDLENLIEKVRTDEELSKLVSSLSNKELRDLIWSYLKLASMASHPTLSGITNVPLVNVNVHNFFKTIDRLYKCNKCNKIFLQPRNECECTYSVDEIGVCRFCGKEFIVTLVQESELVDWKRKLKNQYFDEKLKRAGCRTDTTPQPIRLKKVEYQDKYSEKILPVWQSNEKPLDEDKEEITPVKKCLKCGSLADPKDLNCVFCNSKELKEVFAIVRKELKSRKGANDEEIGVSRETQPTDCPFCGRRYGSFSALSPVSMSPNTASVTVFDMIYTLLPEDFRKLLIFTDNRQAASYLAGYLEDGHLDHAIRNLLYIITKEKKRILLPDLLEETIDRRINTWYGGHFEGFDVDRWDIKRKVLEEVASLTSAQRSIENLGLIEINYLGLEQKEEFEKKWRSFSFSRDLPQKENIELWRNYLISLLNQIRTNAAMKGLERNRPGRDKVIGYNLNDKKIAKKWVEVRGILSLRARSIPGITRKAFSTSNDDREIIRNILRSSFEFLQQQNFLIRVQLEKWGNKSEGFVVSDSKIIVKIPQEIWKCDKCQRIYTNSPLDICLTYRCEGKLTKIDYQDFLKENSDNYYINLYTREIPIKMVTKEDTGALELRERREIESEFKKESVEGRKVDTIVATPTLELGVDIGDLLSVGLFKAPPSPANYIQRVGRAGRKERVSFNNTFLFLTPIDKFYYKNPEKLIKGEIESPVIDLGNKHILPRHVNSLILEQLLVHSIEDYPYLMKNFSEDALEKLLSEIDSRRTELKEKISLALKDLPYAQLDDTQIEAMLEFFKKCVRYYTERYKKEIETYKEYKNKLIQESEWDNVKKLDEQIKKLEEVSFVSYLMNMNVLPRYAFPGVLVEIKDERGYEDFGARARNYAITEYAPLMEVYLKKKIYKSTGIDRNILTPTRKIFYICPNCQKYATDDENKFKPVCPLCRNKITPQKIECIEPNIIYIRKTNKRLNEPRDYQEAVSNIYFERTPTEEKPLDEEKNIILSKYENIELIQIVDKVIIESEEHNIEICKDCGRAKENLRDERDHWKLGPRTKKEKCKGKFEKLALFHKMPTNVISIKLAPDATSLFGVDVTGYPKSILLTTLKNAIINAALWHTQAQDGEIDGEIKGDEIILYDNVDGGAGYVDRIFNDFTLILKRAADIVLECECESGCLDCLWSYRRKRDIKHINKKSVVEFFKKVREIYSEVNSKESTEAKSLEIKNTKTIYSPSYNFAGLIELRDYLRIAKEEIAITSLYITEGKIPWPDEIEKSWVDILTGIKLSSKENVRICIVVRAPTSKEHTLALKKLVDAGIEVYVYKKEVENKLPSIVHSKLVVIDPHIPTQRYAIHASANFSPEMWKNHETFDLGDDEAWVKSTHEEIQKLIKESYKPTKEELEVSEVFESRFLTPGENIQVSINKILEEFSKATSEICIMDPYLTRLAEFEKLIHNYVHKYVKIKIVTARTESDKLLKLVNKLKNEGREIKVVRFFDRERKTGKETNIHDRYIIFNQKRVIVIGKGINAIIEALDRGLRENVICTIISNQNEVKKYHNNFIKYFEYEKSPSVIKDFPKMVF